MTQQEMFAEVETAGGDPATSHRARILNVMRLYSARGKTLEEISDARIIGRSIRTLRQYCAKGKIAFPDWVTRSMRPKKPRKSKRSASV